MNIKPKIMFVFGTRPEAIKMAPVIQRFKSNEKLEVGVCVTAQHREMLDQALRLFDIKPDFDLNLMRPGQDLTDLTSNIFTHLRGIFSAWKPDWIFVHGDTTTAASASLAAYYMRIPVAHVEAGLRTNNIYSPWPEELNRKIIATIAEMHFSPTNSTRENLLREGVQEEKIFVTGNTVIDSLHQSLAKITSEAPLKRELEEKFKYLDSNKKIILVTGHRRENFGKGFEDICSALKSLAFEKEVQIVYPVHLNPNVSTIVKEKLLGIDNIHLIEPLDYLPFIFLMSKSYIILTDSGGIQEEAPALGKPVLVMRDTTERPEAVKAGTAILVGTDPKKIVAKTIRILNDPSYYGEISSKINPYGNGDSANKIYSSFISGPGKLAK